ncbi:hypothetical protein Cst_c00050 [Thermoclostridium stercorarium subsp. stercorarium DSM 8532]|jgi:regulator of extracellular matrix RemA (YlzA/DUF370 family)|uniref:DUF370 domain-containing protein n=3 Tax=Thermoclostridium stercorarium TaxID=1510 RepID=L7VGE0_THES1|nr:DUF370 domain-containing protein [Thermoclostridium stercorarium]AGC67040.1 hypothetical protein Cst_c00050 [Thermoclostridium stercorarium subsp. stercorarium DSM 8532]ANW97535.1 hypothetical protein CSTERTH_00020 [Thermoclostridium stercorarium subsp. thermolacticum DSM 2910]ANX00095.1 hypothetical protein CSTERLE_00020 [Thermoclostridium stercorarium subsp. leptospartum DSM 9219]UZQ85656.1 DUF370 domain-containing protein [Thermoclostridium stercorarium]
MFLHIGGDYMVFTKDIVAIIDMERSTVSQDTRNFLKTSEEEGFIVNVDENELPKSIIITQGKYSNKVYLSPISTTTLYKRFMKKE